MLLACYYSAYLCYVCGGLVTCVCTVVLLFVVLFSLLVLFIENYELVAYHINIWTMNSLLNMKLVDYEKNYHSRGATHGWPMGTQFH